jgi:hypothetical protein
MTFLYHADAERGMQWAALFAERAPDIAFSFQPHETNPADVRYLGVWYPPADIVTTYPNLQVVFSLGAGVDQLDLAALPSDLPVIRMIEPGISDGMAEYATLGVLALHRHLLSYVSQQRRGDWRGIRFGPAARLRVGIMVALRPCSRRHQQAASLWVCFIWLEPFGPSDRRRALPFTRIRTSCIPWALRYRDLSLAADRRDPQFDSVRYASKG